MKETTPKKKKEKLKESKETKEVVKSDDKEIFKKEIIVNGHKIQEKPMKKKVDSKDDFEIMLKILSKNQSVLFDEKDDDKWESIINIIEKLDLMRSKSPSIIKSMDLIPNENVSTKDQNDSKIDFKALQELSQSKMLPEKFPTNQDHTKVDSLGFVYAMLPLSKEWKWFNLKWKLPMLYFYNSPKDHDFIAVYSIYKANILLTT